MLAFKYKGGISKNRIIKAFDFLKQRSDEASLAARREASMIQKQEEQQRQEDADAAVTAGDTGDGEQTEKTEEELFGLKRAPWEKNADGTLPVGGAGLVSLMGDMSSLEQRIQGGWTLAIRAGGRFVSWALLVTLVNRSGEVYRQSCCGRCGRAVRPNDGAILHRKPLPDFDGLSDSRRPWAPIVSSTQTGRAVCTCNPHIIQAPFTNFRRLRVTILRLPYPG